MQAWANIGMFVCRAETARLNRMAGILNWWDGVELWLSGLGFVPQVLIVMPFALGLAFGLATLLDGALGATIGLLQRIRRRERGEGA